MIIRPRSKNAAVPRNFSSTSWSVFCTVTDVTPCSSIYSYGKSCTPVNRRIVNSASRSYPVHEERRRRPEYRYKHRSPGQPLIHISPSPLYILCVYPNHLHHLAGFLALCALPVDGSYNVTCLLSATTLGRDAPAPLLTRRQLLGQRSC